MNTAILLRIAAALAAVQGVAHGALFLAARPRHGPAEVMVVEAMKANRFFAGNHGYWDFYFGYGLLAAAACLVQAALLWQLARIAGTQPALVRPMIGLFILANVGHALLLMRYFSLYLPIAFDLLIAACLAWAFVAASHPLRAAG